MKSITTIGLLTLANIFMTLAWYGHLKFKEMPQFNRLSLFMIILISWGIAFFEYIFQVPANKYGYIQNGGTFTLVELKVIQEVITLTVFTLFTFLFFKDEVLRWNHLAGFVCLILAVYFIFNKF
ncbi:MAG: DMT family protein [Candidatus Kapabacteria bacterium]|nr:DMT family protein [Ignavibacteriota bacterium]MCW5884934.1 DMT family protein [Candidatus Kapabacteria bacterium]